MKYQSKSEEEAARQREAEERRFDEFACHLPGALFVDDEEIRRLTQKVDELTLPERRVAHLRESRRLENRLMHLKSHLGQCRQELKQAAITDALAGDFNFPRGVAVARRATEIQRQIDAAQAAIEATTRGGPWCEPPVDLEAAQGALRDALMIRQRQYLSAHPELLRYSTWELARCAVFEQLLKQRAKAQAREASQLGTGA